MSDLDVFLSDFGVDAEVGGGTVTVIFDAPGSISRIAGVAVETIAPQIHVKTSDAASWAHGDTVTIAGVNYTITEITPDGTGISRVVLSRS